MVRNLLNGEQLIFLKKNKFFLNGMVWLPAREALKSQGPGLWVSLKVLQGDLTSMQVIRTKTMS